LWKVALEALHAAARSSVNSWIALFTRNLGSSQLAGGLSFSIADDTLGAGVGGDKGVSRS
jgi:hypothetical protein